MKRTTIAKDVSVILQKTVLVYVSFGSKIKVFHRSLEALNYAFAHKNSQLQKITFQNKPKTMVHQNIYLQSLQDVGILTRSSSSSLRLLSSFVFAFISYNVILKIIF